MLRIAFDLDETLGVPLIDGSTIVGWQLRQGGAQLLDSLKSSCELLLWSMSSRRYVDQALAFGLGKWFTESYSWNEVPGIWKDVRKLRVDFLVDDSRHHRDSAAEFGLSAAYILVPGYGGSEDLANPLKWVQLVREATERQIGNDVLSQ